MRDVGDGIRVGVGSRKVGGDIAKGRRFRMLGWQRGCRTLSGGS